jgi:spore coat protein U-like protein
MNKLIFLFVFLLLCGARLEAQSCQLNGTSQIAFGTYSSATVQTTGGFSVNCSSGVAFSIALNAGTTAGATVANRMIYCTGCTPKTLGYQLFTNASYSTIWGDNTNGTYMVNATGTGSSQNFTIWAQIPALEYYFPNSYGGNYTDIVTVTIVCAKCTSIPGNNQPLNVNLQQTAVGCGISANALSFGTYTGTVLNATSTLQVGCSSGTTYNVGLNQGTATGATVTNRSMTGTGGALLGYKLFSNSGHTTNWGNTVGTDTVPGTGTGVTQSLTVYGQIPAGKPPALGTYTDTITATVTY